MPETIAEALEEYLSQRPVYGADVVRAAAARKLAAAVEEAPPYAVSRLVEALMALLETLIPAAESAGAAELTRRALKAVDL